MEQNILKRLFIAFSLFLSAHFSSAQEIINVDRYQVQMPMLNPALSGMWTNELAVGARWSTGIIRQPVMPIVRIDGYSPILNSGFGLSVTGTANKRGAEDIFVRGNYNYQYRLQNSAKISAGLVLEFGRTESAAGQIGEASTGFGLAYGAPNWHIGFAAQQLISIYNQSTGRRQNPIYVATANYIFRLKNNFGLQPEAMIGIRAASEIPFYNFGLKANYKFAYLGVHYIQDDVLFSRVANRIGFSTGLVLFKLLNIDYAYTTAARSYQEFRNTLTLRLFITPDTTNK